MCDDNEKEEFKSLDFIEQPFEQMEQNAQQFYATMKKRRTVRSFSDRDIPEQVITNAILAAGTAPSGANLQPWHFAVVSDSVIKKAIRQAAEKEEQEFYSSRAPEQWLNVLKPLGTNDQKPFLETAPYLIVIFLKKHIVNRSGEKQKIYYPLESVGIATGILITALHLSGVATLTHTPSPMRFLNTILERPETEKPFLILVAGYPTKDAKVPNISKHSLEDIARFF